MCEIGQDVLTCMDELTWAQGLGLSQSKNRVACKSMAQAGLAYYERMFGALQTGVDPVSLELAATLL